MAAINPSILYAVIPIIIVQYVLALICLMKLFKNKPHKLNVIVWNIIIVLLVLIGPLLYILLEHPQSAVTASEEVAHTIEKPEKSEDKPSDYSI